jgi:hypothetical protein
MGGELQPGNPPTPRIRCVNDGVSKKGFDFGPKMLTLFSCFAIVV